MGKQVFNIKGMLRDLDPAKSSNQYAYEIRNLRLTAQEDSTMLALVSEKGNLQYTIKDEEGDKEYTMSGNIIGYCTMGMSCIVVFTHDGTYGDFIYKLVEAANNVMLCTCLYGYDIGSTVKDLGFSSISSIEAIGIYENENIQKVYWIDGVHQPRVINIAVPREVIGEWDAMTICPFDFLLEMSLTENVTISYNPDIYGLFPPGTIQYILSYSASNGQTSPAFYTSSLYYTSLKGRAGSPEETCCGAYEIKLLKNTVDTNFDYVTIYSVARTSLNGTPICKKVVDLKIADFSQNSYISYVDTGLQGETVSYSEILYLGGSNIVPYTMEQKNNTLFFGNIQYNDFVISQDDMETIADGCSIEFSTESSGVKIAEVDNTFYPYASQVCPPVIQFPGTSTYIRPSGCASYVTTFKFGESYYFGIIAQNKYGQWSNVIPLNTDGRVINKTAPGYPNDKSFFQPVIVKIYFTSAALQLLEELDCKKLKVVRLDETPQIACQGVLCPTVFSKSRVDTYGLNYAQSSWYFRPIRIDIKNYFEDNKVQYYHNKNLQYKPAINCNEVQGSSMSDLLFDNTPTAALHDTDFFVDWNLLTLHSPDIEFGDQSGLGQEDKIRLVGIVPIEYGITSMFVNLSTPPHSASGGYISSAVPSPDTIYWTNNAPVCLSNFYFLDDSFDERYDPPFAPPLTYYEVFPWHRSTSLSAQTTPDDNDWYGELGSKCMATLRSSYRPIYIEDWVDTSIDITKFKCCDSLNNTIQIESDPNYNGNPRIYHGNVDVVLQCPDVDMYGKSSINSPGSVSQVMSTEDITIRMNYKSSTHGVFALKYNPNKTQWILPNTTDQEGSQRSGGTSYPQNFTAKYIICAQNSSDIAGAAGAWGEYMVVKKTLADTYIQGGIQNSDFVIFRNPNNLDDDTSLYGIGWHLCNPTGHPYYGSYSPDTWYWLTLSGNDYVHEYSNGSPDSGGYHYVYLYVSSNDTALYQYYNNSEVYLIYRFHNSVMASLTRIGTTNSWSSELSFSEITGINFPQWVSEMNHDIDYMYLADVIRNRADITDFTGTKWVVAGLAKNVPANSSSPLVGDIGDAFFQRYDCLKTYPYSPESQNQIVEILSFMCETRVNVDGRYDIRRGMTDNTIQNDTNFNKVNIAYSQQDNFYTPIYLDSDASDVTYFPNQLIWSKTKVYGSRIDAWTSIIATSTLDLNGSLGKIKSLNLWNDNLICFQDMGIAKIMYNERTTISTQQGIPIEIANSGKVDGAQYISNQVGCSNKDSIQVTPGGIYFIDSNTRDIYKWSQSLDSLSKLKGFNTYLQDDNIIINNEKTFYDSKLRDVYFRIPRRGYTECLVYNEQLQEFTSFFDYDMDFMFNFKDSLISVQHASHNLWKQFAGTEYLRYFGKSTTIQETTYPVYEDYMIELVANEKPTEDKIFTNVEFRADVLAGSITSSSQSTYSNLTSLMPINKIPFKTMKVWNEYQDTGDVDLVKMIRKNTNLAQKFRIWRTLIDRDMNDKDHKFNRIRSPWARVRLIGGDELRDANTKTVIHDIAVMYV